MFDQSHREFESYVEWNTETLTHNCIAWLDHTELLAQGHGRTFSAYTRSNFFCTSKVESLMSGTVPKKLCRMLRILTQTTLLVKERKHYRHFQYPMTLLQDLLAFSGSQVLRGLEATLRRMNRAQMSLAQLRVLLLLLCGTMTAVGYIPTKVILLAERKFALKLIVIRTISC